MVGLQGIHVRNTGIGRIAVLVLCLTKLTVRIRLPLTRGVVVDFYDMYDVVVSAIVSTIPVPIRLVAPSTWTPPPHINLRRSQSKS